MVRDGEVVFVDRPVELKLINGVVRCEMYSGEDVIHLAIAIPTFIESFARAGLLAHQWQMGQGGDIIELAMFRSAQA
jgi:hypothetical protein